jgi:hypothetical protein
MVNPERALALTEAVRLHADSFGDRSVEEDRTATVETAKVLYAFLVGPVTAAVHYGPIVKQESRTPTGQTGGVRVQIHDDEEFDIELTGAADAKGAPVSDRPGDTTDDATFSSSDTGVFDYRLDPDNPRKATVVANLPGSAVGTVQLGTVTVTHAVDVVPGDVATVNITEGEARKQNA